MAFNPVGMFNTSYNPASLNKLSFVNAMIRLFPAGTQPLFAMSTYFKPLANGPVVSATHGYYVKQFMFAKPVVNGALISSDTTLVVGSTAGCVPGMTFQVPATREIIRVVSITNATTMVIARAFGRQAAGAIADTAVLFNTGNAHTEASTRPTAVSSTATYVPNYTSIFRSAWGITNTAAASQTIMEQIYNNLAETKEECAMAHTLSWEQIALWSQPIAPANDSATGKRIHATQGLIDAVYQYASGNVTNAGSTTTLAQLETALELSVADTNSMSDSASRVVLTDRKGFKVISDIGRLETKDKVQMDYGETMFGTRYNRFRSTFGDFTIVEDKMLNGNGQPTGLAIAIDPMVLGVGYLGGRDAVQEGMNGVTDSLETGLDAQQGGLLTEMVFATQVPSACAVINGLTAAA
jgi:hypothetical protein